MNPKIENKLLLLTLMIILLSSTLLAQQTGQIRGVVLDSHTGDPLPGATLLIQEYNLGAVTNLRGEFTLNNIPEGTHPLTVSYLGYQGKEVNVDVVSNQTKSLEVKLELLTVKGAEVVITAQTIGQRAAINQQYRANTIKNVVSSEKIEELPDANAAEAIGRLPGISLKRNSGEANKIVIRGLSPKYNNVTIEGIKMASTGDFDRSVDLSLLQSELLSGIEVSKSLRPDMDADALGGTVNLRLLEAPEKRQIILFAEGGYAGLSKDFANYKFTAGASNRFFDNAFGASLKLSREQKQMPSDRFNGDYSGIFWDTETDNNGNIVDSSLSVNTEAATLTDRFQSRTRTNASLILDYKSDWWTVKFFNLYSQKNDDVLNRDFDFTFITGNNVNNFEMDISEEKWKTGTRTHTLQNAFNFGSSQIELHVSTTYAESKQNEQGFPFVEVNRPTLSQTSLGYKDPQNLFEQIGGPESLSIEDTYLTEFNLGDRNLTDESYDVRLDYELSYALSNQITGKFKIGGKYHQLERVSDGTARFSDFEWGGSVARRQALISQFPYLTTDINSQRGISAHNFVDNNYAPGVFLNGRYELGWTADVDMLTDLQNQFYTGEDDSKYYLSGTSSYIRDYSATENLTAGYLMTELNIGNKLMILPGIRYEKNETEYFAFHIRTNDGITGIEPNPDSVTINRSNEKWFPSVNAKYELTSFINLQGAVYKSTTRPSFRRISPLVIYPSGGTYINSNNPFLKPSTAWNYDFGVSVMQSKIGLFTVFGFYKEIDDLIFNMDNYKPNKKGQIVGGPEDLNDRILGNEYYDEFFVKKGSRTNIPINNPERAYVRGLEFSWQTNFWYLPGLLKGLVLDINYSIIDTRTKYPYFREVVVGVDSSGFFPTPITGQEYNTRKGPMEDQPENILNIILGWDYKGFSSRISYRFQQGTLEGLDTRYSVFDRYYDDFSLIDIMIKQKITENVSAYVNMTNVGNHIDDFFFGEQPGKPALSTSSQYYGTRVQFGVRFKL